MLFDSRFPLHLELIQHLFSPFVHCFLPLLVDFGSESATFNVLYNLAAYVVDFSPRQSTVEHVRLYNDLVISYLA